MAKLNYNERSWAIDVISEINDRSKKKDLMIKRAGGENTINDEEILFPDVVLFSDSSLGNILQAWELKMPDTDINNNDLIKNAFIKANKLKLSSFLVWNVNQADLYEVTDENYELLKTWNSEVNLSREDVEVNQVYWKKLLYEILDDLDYLFETNQLIPRQSLDSITGEAISDILLNNFKLVSTEIKNNCSSNFILNDDVNIWWSSAKLEYGKNANKYDCLAKLVLISWINKFLFANLLKKNYKIAYNIDKIKGDVSVLEAIDIIENISNKCDFKNIFQSQLGEDCLPDSVWISLINFNNFLIDNRLEELDDDVVHSILRNTILGSKRRYYGQFPTPFNLALFLVTLVIEDKSKLVFDPCCGTGTILSAAYLLKSKFISEKESINSLWASDKFNFPLQLAMLSLTSPNHIGELIHIFNDDVIDLYEGKELSFQDPFSGEVTVEKLPKMDYILSNLPFVQQEDIKKYNPLINSKINSMIKSLVNNDDLGLDGKSDLYAYIPFSLWDLLNDGGKLGIVISNSWLGTNSGKKFYNTLHYFYEIEYVITSARGRWFEDVSVVTNILILKKRNEPLKNSNLNEKTVYVTLNEDINSDEFFENIDEICSEIRKGTLSKRFERVSYTKAEEESLLDMGLSYNALFSNVKWLFDIKDNLIKSSEICTIKRGERRGWDKLFFPVNHNIEKDYIKKVIKNSKELSGYYVDVEGSDAFCCEKSIDELKALNHHGALSWIKQFENQLNNNGKPLPQVLARSNMYWYTMKDENVADICISLNPDKRIFFTRLKSPCFVNQRLIRIQVNDDVDSKLVAALLNSILGLFFVESLGFGRGLGVLDLNASNLNKNLSILNYNLIGDDDVEKILKAYNLLENRDVYNLEDELIMDDRKQFDLEVLSAFGLEKYYDDILSSFMNMYNRRKSVEI